MKNFWKQIEKKSQCWDAKRKSVFRLEAHSRIEFQKSCDILHNQNNTSSIFYVTFYRNEVLSDCLKFIGAFYFLLFYRDAQFFKNVIIDKEIF